MGRLCERPGCSQPAELFYGIDAERLTVWIQSIDLGSNIRAGVLCRRHADAMVVPLGWMLDDQREPTPRLFKAPATEAPAPARARRHRAQLQPDSGEQLSLGEVVTAPTAVQAGADLPTTDVQPWLPVFDETDDLGGLLKARGPLLSRAFRGQHPPQP